MPTAKLTLAEQYDSSKLILIAINTLLAIINEPPIQTEEDVVNILEAQIAESLIIQTTKEVLADGWDVNTDNDYTFPIDQEGYISIPYNVLDLSSSDGDLIMRDWRLYSKKNQSAIFEESQKLNILWSMEFNSLTHPMRNYITLLAALKFQATQVMDTNLYSYSKADAEKAYISARRSEGRTGSYNILSSGKHGMKYNARP